MQPQVPAMGAPTRSTSLLSVHESSHGEAKTQPQRIPTRPPMRESSQSNNMLMRQDIAAWAHLNPVPPSCQMVSFSSWRRFSATSGNSRSSEEMRASVLLEEHGTTPDYDPPLLERCPLRVDEDAASDTSNVEQNVQRSSSGQHVGNPSRYSRTQHARTARTSSTSSWTTATSDSSSRPSLSKLDFQKRKVRPASTTSLLTEGFKESPKCRLPPKAAMEKIGKELGFKALKIEDLPEDAFDSDSDDEV
ncbi:hypothetical protein GRF29_8g558694 [Pseudopithomyces chartarum]|uniref:Uncharacterized protein n=1 Tax=Pseudopithomyces chartarum TaxID=1892770 RepID=A0AAN6RLN1_9PLEO|nr:hypothetical protein GRF29_8g558694 [Pseudopithomyces chartarum]